MVNSAVFAGVGYLMDNVLNSVVFAGVGYLIDNVAGCRWLTVLYVQVWAT